MSVATESITDALEALEWAIECEHSEHERHHRPVDSPAAWLMVAVCHEGSHAHTCLICDPGRLDLSGCRAIECTGCRKAYPRTWWRLSFTPIDPERSAS